MFDYRHPIRCFFPSEVGAFTHWACPAVEEPTRTTSGQVGFTGWGPSGKSSAGKPHISWEKFHGFRFSLKPIHKWLKSMVSDTLWLFNMAMDNGP